jgi:molybdenum cofactor cytidylyltransferase
MSDFHALVLAAGSGTRFGGRKLLASWEDGVLIHAALDAAATAPVAGITLVTGADSGEISAAAQGWAGRRGEMRLRIIHAADHYEGLAASLRAGLGALPPTTEGAFIFLGDMPRIPARVVSEIAQAFTGDILAVAPFCNDRRGHPVLVSRQLFGKLQDLRGDRGAKPVIDELGPRLVLVRTDDDGVLFDVDRVEDLSLGASPA